MQIDIDEIVDGSLPWDLVIRLNGVSYDTRPIVLGDIARLEAALASSQHHDLVAAIRSILDAPEDACEGLRLEKLIATVQAVLSYWKAEVQKNSPAVAAKVATAMAASLGSGSSTRPS